MQNFKLSFLFILLFTFLFVGCSTFNNGFLSKNNDNSPLAVSEAEADEMGWGLFGRDKKTTAVVTFHAIGRGIAPENATSRGQAIILGESAARANGYVKLAEKIHGVYVDSYRHMGKGGIDYEVVYQQTQALLKGAEILEYRQLDHGIFEVHMEVKLLVNQGHPLFPRDS